MYFELIQRFSVLYGGALCFNILYMVLLCHSYYYSVFTNDGHYKIDDLQETWRNTSNELGLPETFTQKYSSKFSLSWEKHDNSSLVNFRKSDILV